ncbi:hypothetical protein CC1G_12395 [Coprinopsis cinerea okayama7|uniref:MYND-type domain-containing protein n=1 Tax=Coprinopsis cinerea (strain Okayama-7 / 130 / ATCC MYA-4618 / FGSC 9003) TaxID=240176 RepID=A8P349_COPC7|nr:hypothetical protein CC1G_12395 [Coprinopsis cinerea okayama7\|eukprot:XP_001838471.1 hypothetical protein CC1G_12395 [Coprinopsis cinerea okayama7\
MAYYSQPAAANYNTPPTHSQRQRGYRICDACGVPETPSVKFRLCGGCMTTQYCSQDCQKSHWPSHKAICQHTAASVSKASAAATGAGYGEELAKNLRKFTSAHSALLGWAGFQALQLKRVPANVRQNALLIELNHLNHADSHRRFSITSTHIVPRSYIRDPLVLQDIQRREERCRQNGGIGALIVILQCGGVSQVMPVEVDPPAKITWDEREDWPTVLNHFVSSGRTDFKPISTTSRGVFYG